MQEVQDLLHGDVTILVGNEMKLEPKLYTPVRQVVLLVYNNI